MHKLDKSAGQVIAADTQSSVEAIDQAVLSYSRLCASIIEVSSAAKLPVTTAQKALENATSGLTMVVKGREEIAVATRELLKIQKASSLDAVSFGCPNGFPEPSGHLQADEIHTA